MKYNYLKYMLTALLLVCAMVAGSADFQVGGICYNILSQEERTVEVTLIGDGYSTFHGEYTGNMNIPGMF